MFKSRQQIYWHHKLEDWQRDSHRVCISYVPPCLGWTDCILPEVRAGFPTVVRPFSVQGYTKLYTPPRWSSSHEKSPYWIPWHAFRNSYPGGAVSTSLQIFDDTNRMVNQTELPLFLMFLMPLETWSLCSLSSLFLYTWRQLLLFYSGICNRRENTRWFAKWRGIKLCQVLSGVYSQMHTPISQTVLLQYFSTKTKNGARCIIVHFFMGYKLPMYSNTFVLVICALLFLKCMLVRQNLAAICQQWKR